MANDILSNVTPAAGSRKKRKRIGRGQGSGHGGTATRGHKGAKSRSGYHRVVGFEGGQMPLVRRVPKRGFNNPFKKVYHIINVERLEELSAKGRLQGGVVNPEVLAKLGVVKKPTVSVKILGNGELKAKLDVAAHAFSRSAQEKIEKAGGRAHVLSVLPKEQ